MLGAVQIPTPKDLHIESQAACDAGGPNRALASR